MVSKPSQVQTNSQVRGSHTLDMDFQSVRVFLELPRELVVMEVPKVEAQRRFLALDAVQLPFPPPYDPSGEGVAPSSSPYHFDSGRTSDPKFYEAVQLPLPPSYDPVNRNL